MHSLLQDLRFGLRSLRKDRAFTLLAVLALALGIGSVTTIYSVIQNVLLDPFPYKNAGRIFTLEIRDTDRDNDWRGAYRIPEILDFQASNQVFEDMVAAGHEDVLYANGEGVCGCFIHRWYGDEVMPLEKAQGLGLRTVVRRYDEEA